MKPFSDFANYLEPNTHNLIVEVTNEVIDDLKSQESIDIPEEILIKHYASIEKLTLKTLISVLQLYHTWLSEQVQERE